MRRTTGPCRRGLHSLLFSGQGTQHGGMARDLYAAFPAARRVLDAVDDELGFALTALMFDERADGAAAATLRRTSNAQPAIFAHSMAVLACLAEEGFLVGLPSLDGRGGSNSCSGGSRDVSSHNGDGKGNVGLLMGHSLGEFSAAAAAGCFSLRHTARIVRARGESMQRVADGFCGGKTAMVALLGRWDSLEKAQELCARAVDQSGGKSGSSRIDESSAMVVCEVANWNSGTQVVVSGSKSGVDQAVALAKAEYGVRRAMQLDVRAPFHCSLMAPVEPIVRRSMEKEVVVGARARLHAPMVMNVDGRIEEECGRVRDLLCAQTVGSVNWVACMNTAVEYARQHGERSPTFIELGPGKVLKGLIAREVHEDPVTGTKPHVLSVGTAAEVDAILLQAQDEGWLGIGEDGR